MSFHEAGPSKATIFYEEGFSEAEPSKTIAFCDETECGQLEKDAAVAHRGISRECCRFEKDEGVARHSVSQVSLEEKPLISIIVPVYKVENYLDRCVRSLVAQTYENIEIILVDDGSPDGSPVMCDRWADTDERIRVIHKENGGLSDARNAGVYAAKGSYIGFVDSDDYVAADMYEVLFDLMAGSMRKIAICGVANVYASYVEPHPAPRRTSMSPEEALSDIFLNKTLMVGIPPRLYPAWLVKEVPNPVGKTHEDAFVVVDQISRVDSVEVDTTPRYYYCHNEGTITSRPSTRALDDNIEAWEHNRRLVERLYPGILDDVLFRCYWAHFDVLDGMMLSPATDEAAKEKVVSYLKENRAAILAHPRVSAKRKLALSALCASEGLYRVIVHLQNRRVKYC